MRFPRKVSDGGPVMTCRLGDLFFDFRFWRMRRRWAWTRTRGCRKTTGDLPQGALPSPSFSLPLFTAGHWRKSVHTCRPRPDARKDECCRREANNNWRRKARIRPFVANRLSDRWRSRRPQARRPPWRRQGPVRFLTSLSAHGDAFSS